MPSRLGRLEVARVELLVEISAPVVSEAIKATIDALDETVPTEFAKATASVISSGINTGNLAVTRDSPRSHVALLAKDLEDAVVSRLSHPVCVPSHLALSCGGCHSNTDVITDSSHSLLFIRSIASTIQLLAGKD